MRIEFSEISERPDFKTNLIYVERLSKLSSGISLSCNLTPLLRSKDLSFIKDRTGLIALTKKSIEDENHIVDMDKEYSIAVALWLPVKTYYLLYHLLSVIDCILTAKKSSLRLGHSECLSSFSEKLGRDLFFNQPIFNLVFDKNILNFKEKPGEHLSNSASDDLIYKLIMKRTGRYKLDDYKRTLNSSTKRKKAKIQTYLTNRFNISIFDFFYQMRIKSNYKNFNFMEGMPAIDTRKYFKAYYLLSDNFFNCLNNLENRLIASLPI